ncbi:MAG: cupin domain-containing protein [Chitinophagaceae bacterium]
MKAILIFSLQLTIALTLSAQDTLPARVYHLADMATVKDSSRYRLQIMDGATSIMPNLEAHLTILEPGKAAHPPHTHASQEELIIVKEGMLKVTIAGKSKVLTAGGIAYSFPGDEHGAVNVGKTKTAYYVIKYSNRTGVDKDRVAKAGESILMNWNDPKVDKTDRGERRSFFNQPTPLFGKFDMHATTLNQGQVSHLPHTHRSEEILIIRTGKVRMHIGDNFYPASPGDLVFLPTGVPHALENTGSGSTSYFAFQWE